MNRQKKNTCSPTSPLLNSSSSEIKWLFSLEDCSLIQSNQRLHAILNNQNNSLSKSSHFQNLHSKDLKSEQIDKFLLQNLFDSQILNPLKRRPQQSLNDKSSPNSSNTIELNKTNNLPSLNSPSLRSSESDLRKKQRNKFMSNLQASLSKSYQNYRQNFYSMNDADNPSHDSQLDINFPPYVNKPCSVQHLSNEDSLVFNKLEIIACRFVNINIPDLKTCIETRRKFINNARKYSLYKITVDADDQKDPKPSISTQCSNQSALHYNY